jgi:hypothetical protein
MSTQSEKTARRSTKTPRRTVKKTTKSARSSDKKTSKVAKSARRGAGTAARPARPAAIHSSSATSKSTTKAAVKAASKSTPQMIRTLSPPVQPVAMYEIPLMAHKYHVGETVYYTSPTSGRAAATGSYTVIKLLPSEGDDYQYRIKSSGEAFERVAKESQLDRL